MDNSDFRAAQDGKLQAGAARENGTTSKTAAGHLRRDNISVEALISVLVQQGLCTEEQLLAEEARLRAAQRTMANLHFKPVRVTPAQKHGKPQKHSLKKWASQRRWTRQLGSFLFGWRWQKYKKKERSGSSPKNISRAR